MKEKMYHTNWFYGYNAETNGHMIGNYVIIDYKHLPIKPKNPEHKHLALPFNFLCKKGDYKLLVLEQRPLGGDIYYNIKKFKSKRLKRKALQEFKLAKVKLYNVVLKFVWLCKLANALKPNKGQSNQQED